MLISRPIRGGCSRCPPYQYPAGTHLSLFAEHDLGRVCILDSLFGTVAKLEGSEALALSDGVV